MRAALFAIAALLLTAAPAAAQEGPEELEQLEPDGGRWQIEYYGIAGRHASDSHALQLLYGVSDHLALGIEADGEWRGDRLRLDGVAPTLLYRFSDAEEGFGVGVELQAELDGHARFAGAEARLILARRSARWWGQGNAMLRHVREDDAAATGLAYGWTLNRAAGGGLWLGVEGSGQAGRIGGSPLAIGDGGHFLGPALTFETVLPHGEIEIGIAWLRRIAGEGARDSARLFVQWTL